MVAKTYKFLDNLENEINFLNQFLVELKVKSLETIDSFPFDKEGIPGHRFAASMLVLCSIEGHIQRCKLELAALLKEIPLMLDGNITKENLTKLFM